MKYIISILIFITFLSVNSIQSQNKTISITTCDWEPYAGEALQNYGFTSEIITQAFKAVGYETKITFYPWKRALLMTEQGRYDAVYNAYYSEERTKTFLYADPYTSSKIYVCAKKDKDIKFSTIQDLAKYRIGVVAGYITSPEFDNADYLKKDPADSDIVNLKKLLADRIDLIIIDKYTAIYHLKTSPYFKETASDVKFIEPVLSELPVYIMFSRAITDSPQKQKDYNRGLKIIKSNNTYSRILRKYGFSEN